MHTLHHPVRVLLCFLYNAMQDWELRIEEYVNAVSSHADVIKWKHFPRNQW